MTATPSPTPTPASASPRASAFERRWVAPKLRVPISSAIAIRSGSVIAEPAEASAGEVPSRTKRSPNRSALSGRIGRSTPASRSTPSAQVASLIWARTRELIPSSGIAKA